MPAAVQGAWTPWGTDAVQFLGEVVRLDRGCRFDHGSHGGSRRRHGWCLWGCRGGLYVLGLPGSVSTS